MRRGFAPRGHSQQRFDAPGPQFLGSSSPTNVPATVPRGRMYGGPATAKTSGGSVSWVADLDFPQNPMDALVAHFGVDPMVEISGRTHRFEGGKYVRR